MGETITFLDREKKLLKLNEELNSKCIELTAKPSVELIKSKKSINKFKTSTEVQRPKYSINTIKNTVNESTSNINISRKQAVGDGHHTIAESNTNDSTKNKQNDEINTILEDNKNPNELQDFLKLQFSENTSTEATPPTENIDNKKPIVETDIPTENKKPEKQTTLTYVPRFNKANKNTKPSVVAAEQPYLVKKNISTEGLIK